MGADIPAGAATGTAPTDDELLAAARQGDAAALEALLVRYQPHLYRFGLRMCGNMEDAGDVAQESLSTRLPVTVRKTCPTDFVARVQARPAGPLNGVDSTMRRSRLAVPGIPPGLRKYLAAF